ncbi:hypothetical protein LQF63_12115 [Tetragenococcus koreensis]|uniref:hypothetical protein n=1 Tax=Tetragenococcus koreensis TaxID=290335 RepID=UPI001F1EA43C|nr:hypothetical protein [Tetragenococcus koreensis]MCF1618371.1 hypothetical protein [Tetragenococcus koreensis]
MGSSHKKKTLREKLETARLEEPVEQGILNSAMERLDNGEKEWAVLKEMKVQFRKLALNQELSQKGLSLYTELQRPDPDVDMALSSITWFQ